MAKKFFRKSFWKKNCKSFMPKNTFILQEFFRKLNIRKLINGRSDTIIF